MCSFYSIDPEFPLGGLANKFCVSYLHATSHGPIRHRCHGTNHIYPAPSSFPSDFASPQPSIWRADILKYIEFCVSEVLSNLACYKALSKLAYCKVLSTLACHKIPSTLAFYKIGLLGTLTCNLFIVTHHWC